MGQPRLSARQERPGGDRAHGGQDDIAELLVRDFWLYEYAPLVLDAEARRYPPIGQMTAALGGRVTVTPVPIPADCTDGFNEAYYARPERLLDPGARLACSAWSFVPPQTADRYIMRLRRDLADGTWDGRYGALRAQCQFGGSLMLIRAVPGSGNGHTI